MGTLDSIKVDIMVELGSATMPIHHMLRMGRGAIIELDTTDTDPVRIFANKTLVARGEINVEDGKVNVKVTEKIRKRA
jgi:flagellar motor switch protein FliN